MSNEVMYLKCVKYKKNKWFTFDFDELFAVVVLLYVVL